MSLYTSSVGSQFPTTVWALWLIVGDLQSWTTNLCSLNFCLLLQTSPLLLLFQASLPHRTPLPGMSFLSSITHLWDSSWISPESWWPWSLSHTLCVTASDLQQWCSLPSWEYLSFWNSLPQDQQWSARKISRIPLSLLSTENLEAFLQRESRLSC